MPVNINELFNVKYNDFLSEKEWNVEKIEKILEECKNFLVDKFATNITNYDNYSNYLNDDLFNINKFAETLLKKLPIKISSDELYYFISNYFGDKIKDHIIYDEIASYFAVKRLHDITKEDYSEIINDLYNIKNTDNESSLINENLYKIVCKNKDLIQTKLNYMNDYNYDFFGIRTLERSYLMKEHKNNKIRIIERPQHMLMRVSLSLWYDNLEKAFQTYDSLSNKYFTQATPTLFNAGTPREQLSSCFLLTIDDNIEHIFDTVKNMALISKYAGGLGVNLSSVRGRGTLIKGTNGKSEGIIPLCVMLEKLGRYINQGGKRKGSIAVYLEPWHCDIEEFVELRNPIGDENLRARDLFLALWANDIFMERVKSNNMWSLMCPDECPGLVDCYGDKFRELYLKYEKEKKYKKQIRAIELWDRILTLEIKSGMPFLLFKDSANKKSNQQNLGTIKSSNLCTEIIEYTDGNTIAVCNLGSICLPMFYDYKTRKINYDNLVKVAFQITENLDRIIDINYYPTEIARKSNLENRPIGVGVQGLPDLLAMLKIDPDSTNAIQINKEIFASIYYGCLLASVKLAKEKGPYKNFTDSPFSKGQLQYDLWGFTEKDIPLNYDWISLKKDIIKYGTRNSLLTTIMPTASTAQIMGNCESIEPYQTNIFIRETLAGEYIVVNKNLIKDLIKLNLWNDNMRKRIVLNNGSIQNIDEIPKILRNVYKTAFEIKLKSIIDQSAARGIFIDQSQSLNLFLDSPNKNKLHSALFYAWEKGLKTGMYYLRSRPAFDPTNFGIDVDEINEIKSKDNINNINNTENINTKRKSGICKFKPGVKLEDCESCSG